MIWATEPDQLLDTVLWAEIHRRRRAGIPTVGIVSIDINGFAVGFDADYSSDPRLGAAIEHVVQQGFIPMISSANGPESILQYLRHMGADTRHFVLMNCGNGQQLFGRVGNQWYGYSRIDAARRVYNARTTRGVLATMGVYAESVGVSWVTSHPTRNRALKPKGSNLFVAGYEPTDNMVISFMGFAWDHERDSRVECPELIEALGGFLLNSVLPAWDFTPRGIEVDTAHNFVYVSGDPGGLPTTKSFFLKSIRDWMDRNLPHGVLTHGDDNHNGYGCEVACDLAYAPSGTKFATRVGPKYTLRANPDQRGLVAVEYLDTVLREVVGRGLPRHLSPEPQLDGLSPLCLIPCAKKSNGSK